MVAIVVIDILEAVEADGTKCYACQHHISDDGEVGPSLSLLDKVADAELCD